MATSAAVIASSAAALSYMNAKYHIVKDISTLYRQRRAERDYAQAVKSNHISALHPILQNASLYPNAPAIWTRAHTYTWSELATHVAQYAHFFLSLDIRPGEAVAFYLHNSPSFHFAWLGLWAIGAAPAMINWHLTGDALVHCLKISGAKIVLSDGESDGIEGVREKVEGELGMKIVKLGEEERAAIESGAEVPMPGEEYRQDIKGDSPAALFYTSGTTGYPKAVPHTHSRLWLGSGSQKGSFASKPGPEGDRWYICLPFYHGTGAITGMQCLMSGVSIAISPGFSVRAFWDDVIQSGSTCFVYVGELARYLLADAESNGGGEKWKGHKLKCMHGNGMRPDVWGRFQEKFGVAEVAEFFNSTEGMFGLLNWDRSGWSKGAVGHSGVVRRWLMRGVHVPVEVDYENNTIVRDEKTGLAVRRNSEDGGEILVQVPDESAFMGYRNTPEATKKKFVRDVLRKGDLYYRTGDALRVDRDGRWWFMDRLGDTFRWKSENVSTAEVAEVIGRYPGILEANVYGVVVPGHDGKAGCAAIDIDSRLKAGLDQKGLLDFARQRLPSYAVPVFVRVSGGDIGQRASHNQKPTKGTLREEGIDPTLRGTKVINGDKDRLLWLPPRGDEYGDFRQEDWDAIVNRSARL